MDSFQSGKRQELFLEKLEEIRDFYCEWFNSDSLGMIQYDVLHTMADLWYWNK